MKTFEKLEKDANWVNEKLAKAYRIPREFAGDETGRLIVAMTELERSDQYTAEELLKWVKKTNE